MPEATVEPKSVEEAQVLGKGGIRYYRTDKLIPWPGLNPRTHFDDELVQEMAASIAEHGILQPILVTPWEGKGVDRIVTGETRFRAAKLAQNGCPEIGLAPVDDLWIPAMVRDLTEGEALAITMLENVQRNSLTPLEEARGFARLLELNNWTQARLAEEMLGSAKRQPYVANRLRLLDLPEHITNLIEAGTIQASHARDYLVPLLKLEEPQPFHALGWFENEVQGMLEREEEISGDWVSVTAERMKQAAAEKFGSMSLFEASEEGTGGKEEQAQASEPEASEVPDEAATVPPFDGSAIPPREDQFDYLLNHALRPSGFVWSDLAAAGASDDQLTGRISLAFKATAGATQAIKKIGSYKAIAGAFPEIALFPLAEKHSETVMGAQLIEHARRLLGIAEPVSTPAPEASPKESPTAPTPESVAAPKPESPKPATKTSKPAPSAPKPEPPAPPSAPVTVLDAPGTARGVIPEGAGLITALLTTMSRRPCVLSMTPLPNGPIAVTVTPKIMKAGEKPFAMTGSADELDQGLVAALDNHFSE